jgi:TetR/AcrR family transcriptional regulator of autoinduction and epiphytic fitness
METVKKRRYDMANRSRQAAETRRWIVEGAARLFLRHGYAATSMNAIAAEAGVAVQTVYASMRTKRDILEAVIQLSVRGAKRDAPVAASARWRQMEAEADPREKLALFARIHREICEREAGLFVVLQTAAAADAELEPLLRDKEQFRYQDQRRVARSLQRRGQLRTGLSARKGSDIIWALASERVYLALVQDRGWSVEEYEAWLTDQLAAALLPADPAITTST